jgi:CheY-like chemotaxis protein
MPSTILLVDDNADTREALRAVLQTRGYAVGDAANGAAALRYLLQGKPADAIVLDLRMPGMTGQELYEELRGDTRLADIPVVVFSALNDDGRLQGIVAYVRKAFDPDLLLEAIERACGPP